MKFTLVHLVLIGIAALVIGSLGTAGFLYNFGTYSESFLYRVGGGRSEGFTQAKKCDTKKPVCNDCGQPKSACVCKKQCDDCGKSNNMCGCRKASKCPPVAPCPRVMEPDLSKYILKSQVPSTNKVVSPDLSNYMLKTECPPVPDLSKYVLKSSIPKPQPVIIDNSKCKGDSGECPPCPRPRCPVVKCPEPTKCAPPAPCPRPVCPPTVVKCKSEEAIQPTVRPFLAPLNMGAFGAA